MADRLGDRLPRMMGKVTLNPFKHIEWNNPTYVIMAVVLPVVTVLSGYIVPMGMAWVMTSPRNSRDHALIAVAGPLGDVVLMLLGFAIWLVLFPMMPNMPPKIGELVYLLCFAFVIVSVVYGVVSMLPIPGLDGGNVLYHFLPPGGRNLFDQLRGYGIFILLGIGFLVPMLTNGQYGIWESIIGPILNSTLKVFFALPKMIWGEWPADFSVPMFG
ncbi:MAG: site-2 protease family protein [Planctomycetaceae bacterium]|nr:site-2 protease family protein [Planctomycetaceae bacterium]